MSRKSAIGQMGAFMKTYLAKKHRQARRHGHVPIKVRGRAPGRIGKGKQ